VIRQNEAQPRTSVKSGRNRCHSSGSMRPTTIREMGRRVFLDLAGTLVEPLKPARLDQIRLIPGVAQAIARLRSAGLISSVP
jgi:hypothetical protein